jgi:uncharacterized protein YfdQ (DUF2303 family)
MLEKLLSSLSLGQSEAIAQAQLSTESAMGDDGVLLLPSDFTRHDLESFQQFRRRMRGTMNTSVIGHFAAYTKEHAEDGASVFIDADKMQASAVLNLGTKSAAGHCDHKAVFSARKSAAYKTLRDVANGAPLSQQEVAEFCEDWGGFINYFREVDGVPEQIVNKHAIAAIRRITIEGLRKVEASEQQLSATRSAFESVTAKSDDPLPTMLSFRCVPFFGLAERSFTIRLGVLTSYEKPSITLRLVNIEAVEEEMAEELADLIRREFDESWASRVLIGTHSTK